MCGSWQGTFKRDSNRWEFSTTLPCIFLVEALRCSITVLAQYHASCCYYGVSKWPTVKASSSLQGQSLKPLLPSPAPCPPGTKTSHTNKLKSNSLVAAGAGSFLQKEMFLRIEWSSYYQLNSGREQGWVLKGLGVFRS